MVLLKKVGEGLLIAGFSFLLTLVFFESRMQLPPWLQVAGRMHPMFLHFPIVLLLVYLFTFWLPVNEPWVNGIRLLATLSAVVTAVMGLLLAAEESREGSTFFWHKWGGVSIAVLAFCLYYLHPFLLLRKKAARPLTFVTCILLLLTGHWGANLTHGENYLLQPVAASLKKAVPLEKAMAFEHIVLPLFQSKCVSCHGAANIKGGLVLDDTTSLLEGGKTGPLFEVGHPEKSLLIKRILLPLDDKKHMAPGSKTQLTDEEVQLLQAWVKAGAPLNQKVISLPVKDSFRILAAAYLSPSSTEEGAIAYDFSAADESKIKALNNNYRVVTPLGAGSPALAVQFYGKAGYSGKALEELLDVKEQIIELNLARLPVKDEELKPLLQFQNLEKLNLNYTDVTPNGLLQLTALKKLNELAVSGTKVSSDAAAQLAKMPSLTSLYVWNTSLDSADVVSLKKTNQKLSVDVGYKDDGKTILPLSPPMAKTAPGIYDVKTKIELKHPYRGVEIRYTLDGTEPDSATSAVYKNPLSIEDLMVVKAKAYKPGWYGSKTMKAVYFIKGPKPDSVEMLAKEQANRGKEGLLSDGETGDLNLGSGAWMELKELTTFQFYFKQPVDLRQISLNTFVKMESDIFPAAKIAVWGGADKASAKPLGAWQQPPPSKMEDPDLKQPLVSFTPAKLQYLKVVVQPLASIPAWRPSGSRGKPSKVYVSEVVLN